MDRPSWDKLFFGMAHIAASRATCDRARHGVVAVKDSVIPVCFGYNGSPEKESHCDDVGHELVEHIGPSNAGVDGQHCIRTIHAEANLIATAAKYGIPLQGTTWYMTGCPCYYCAKSMARLQLAAIKIVNFYKYDGSDAVLDMLMRSGARIDLYEPADIWPIDQTESWNLGGIRLSMQISENSSK